jgi:hypothetical protein
MKENLGHLMLDIESLGNKSNSVVLSVAAVEFNMETGDTGRVFYEQCSIQSGLDIGLKINSDTILWWLEQGEKAIKEAFQGKQHIANMLKNFTFFLEELGTAELKLWGNSNRFDMGLLENAYNALNKEIPWKYEMERDVRTLVSFYPEIKKNTKFEGVKHNPVDDCYHQIKYCVETWKKIQLI